jgi:group I intron endonuclease
MNNVGIYRIYKIDGLPGEEYIGQSADITGRWDTHRRELESGTHHCRLLQELWNGLGADVFAFEVLEEVEHPRMLTEREQWYFDTRKPLYNSTLIAMPHITDVDGSTEYATILTWKETVKKLRKIAAILNESMVAVLDRLVKAEWDRVKKDMGED